MFLTELRGSHHTDRNLLQLLDRDLLKTQPLNRSGLFSKIACVPIGGHDWTLFFGLEWAWEFARWLCFEDRLVGLFEYLVQDGQKFGIVDAKLSDGGV